MIGFNRCDYRLDIRRAHLSRSAFREPIAFSLSGSFGCSVSRKRRSARRDGRLVANLACGPMFGCRRSGSSCDSTGKRSGATASATSGSRLHVSEVRDGRLQSICQFEIDDEEAAFAYAEERVRATASRLAVTNRASETAEASAARVVPLTSTVQSAATRTRSCSTIGDDSAVTPSAASAELRAAAERILDQYSQFDWRTLAVRGDCLQLALEPLVGRCRERDGLSPRARSRR